MPKQSTLGRMPGGGGAAEGRQATGGGVTDTAALSKIDKPSSVVGDGGVVAVSLTGDATSVSPTASGSLDLVVTMVKDDNKDQEGGM